MKKLAFLFTIVLLSFSSIGQDLSNVFYFRGGYSLPSWNHFDVGKDGWVDNMSRTGAKFEFGNIFQFSSILNSDEMVLGLNVDYLYANYNKFRDNDSEMEMHLDIFRVGSKIGPSFTYSPMDKMAIDVYTKADFAWATVAVPYFDDIDNADDYYSDPVAIGFSTGLNFRYSVLIVGIEFNTVSAKLESDDYENVYLQQVADMFINEGDVWLTDMPDEKKSKLPCLNFTIGLCF